MTTDELMTPEQVAELVGVNTGTLANWRSDGKGPRYVKSGRIRYRKSDVWAFINSSVRQSTCETTVAA